MKAIFAKEAKMNNVYALLNWTFWDKKLPTSTADGLAIMNRL